MSLGDKSMDGSLSNEELNGETDIESDNLSETGDVDGVNADKLDPVERQLYEKLKKQERQEREEIERELKAHEEALVRRQEDLLAKERELAERLNQQDRVQDLRVNKSDDFRSHSRDNGISKSDSHSVNPPPRVDPVLNHVPFLSDRGLPGYPRPESHTPQSTSSHSPTDGPTHHWTFEEQFKQIDSSIKQLYELSEDPKRKEFLDDLFAFMQKRGTPVNRIPIMAKQTLDLYELFRLVVSKGGLVEVINKKLWREITKGLNLPSSITSAAFTLRTQYMKYLYPYECEKLKLSSPQELQSAIDGNRREGRRSSYGYDLSPGPTLIPATPPHPLNGMMNGKLPGGSEVNDQMKWHESLGYALAFPQSFEHPDKVKFLKDRRSPISSLRQLWQLQTQHLTAGRSDDESLPPTPTHHRSLTERFTERDAMAMEAASRAMEEATRKMEEASRAALEEPPRKRLHSEEDRLLAHAGMPSAHIKVTSRNDGRTEIDNSLVVSMEINGIMYQGVLFAHQPRRI